MSTSSAEKPSSDSSVIRRTTGRISSSLRRPAGVSDAFEDAVDYRGVAKAVIGLVETSAFFLVEKLAEEIAAICLQNPKVTKAKVRVSPGTTRTNRSLPSIASDGVCW